MNPIYTVKEASKILGFSTNTVYKYLNEGRLRAARGDEDQGRFRIPHEALEQFLGTQLPLDVLTHIRHKEVTNKAIDEVATNPILATTSAPTALPATVARVLLLFSLAGIIIDIVISPSISILGQITRVGIIGVFILLSYQTVGIQPIPNQQPQSINNQPSS